MLCPARGGALHRKAPLLFILWRFQFLVRLLTDTLMRSVVWHEREAGLHVAHSAAFWGDFRSGKLPCPHAGD